MALGADAERDDRLAQRDDDDQPEALGEVAGLDLPLVHTADVEADDVDPDGEDPARGPDRAVEDPGEDEQQRDGQHRACEAADDVGQARVLAAEEDVGADVQDAHDGVGDAEGQRVAAERVRHGDGGDQHRRRGGEERDAEQAVVGGRLVAEPGVGGPGPPDDDQDRHALEQARPGGLGGEEGGDLRDREDEDEVEEELQGGDALLGLGLGERLVGDGQHLGHGVVRCSGPIRGRTARPSSRSQSPAAPTPARPARGRAPARG